MQIGKDSKMAEKWKMTVGKLEKVSEGLLLVFCICIFCTLAYYSANYTMTESTVDTRDSIGMNMLVLAAVTAAVLLLHGILRSGYLRFVRKRILAWKPYIVGLVSVYVYIISLIWVSYSHVAPGGDGAPLCSVAHRMITGNFIDMKSTGYMVIFPHQFGLLSVIHLLFNLFGAGNYGVFQHLNAFCMPLLFYSGYKLLQLVCKEAEIVIYYVFFYLGCLPLFLYVPFVYGEIMSITFTMVLMWQVVRYCKSGKKSCFLWGTAAIVLACIVRKNSLIVLVAAGIVLIIHSIRNLKPWGAVWTLAMILAVSGSEQLIYAHYENISGIEVAGGVPYISWIRMGLQDTWAGPGWFDNSSVEEFKKDGYNTEQTKLAEREHLREILKDMWRDKVGSIDFFRRKILSQWNSPEYSSINETKQFDCEPEALPDFVKRIYYDDTPSYQRYMNRYQFVLYFYGAVSAVALFMDIVFAGRIKEHSMAEYILYIAIVGGFLFSALWEASSRYVIPYIIYMIPLAAWGMYRLAKVSYRGEEQ